MFDEQMTELVDMDDSSEGQIDDYFFSDSESDEGIDDIDTFVLDEDDSRVLAESEAVLS